MNDVRLVVEAEDPPETLRIDLEWRGRLTAHEILVYEALAQMAKGELGALSFRTLARHVGITFNKLRQAMGGLRDKGLLLGVPEEF